MKVIIFNCNILGGLIYVRETVTDHSWGTELTLRNSHESVIVSMTINAQLAHSTDKDILCVSLLSIFGKVS